MASVASAVMLSSELPKMGDLVSGQESQEPFSVWSLFTVPQYRFNPSCSCDSILGFEPRLSANQTAPVLSAFGIPGGLGTPVLPSPAPATQVVSSDRTGSLTAYPRC